MAEKSGFFNAKKLTDGSYDRTYMAEDFGMFFKNTLSNGVFLCDDNNALQVTSSGTNMAVNVALGNGHINGHMYTNTTSMSITLANADPTLDRIDRVVLQLSETNREIKIVVKQGAYSSVAVAPTLTQNADVWEIGLADIYIARGIAWVSTSRNIKDLREAVKTLNQAVDMQDIYNQYHDALEQLKNQNGDLLALVQRVYNLEARTRCLLSSAEPTPTTAEPNVFYFIPEVI
ncbi:hypothetical protein SAMN02745248_00574 [Hathewaya proteolytica DSM 3090]|uniref:Uncharacterized protein n=1 Tax=Hathewaya proteolytica DSM 3090 TaxID=1121331 RepID=A0A1M6L087_9CLOT|nr:hypothetical protein [Hathewaya proteolytica]SHJ64620.1 hypothetical protein SAMN02745248_00574 [Hathewaya proteolytica DSM 3090]